MTSDITASKKPPRKSKQVAPLSGDAFANRQLSLFQGFLVNTTNEREAFSNAVHLWDSIPRYAISRVRMNAMRTAEGFLAVMELPFHYRGRGVVTLSQETGPFSYKAADMMGGPKWAGSMP